MAFKPRIFISSTFSDNKKVRDSIKKHFIELGAEPLLYESNLTPVSYTHLRAHETDLQNQ